MRYSDTLFFAEIRYEGPLKELNNFGVKEKKYRVFLKKVLHKRKEKMHEKMKMT